MKKLASWYSRTSEKCLLTCLLLSCLNFQALAQKERLEAPAHLEQFLTSYLKSFPPTKIAISPLHMPNGAQEEFVLYLEDQDWCGSGGCTMLVLQEAGETYEVLGRTTIVNLPIRQLGTSTYGQPDLGVVVRGGGILQSYEAALHFDGKRYTSNPSMPPATRITSKVQGATLITTDTPLISLSKPKLSE